MTAKQRDLASFRQTFDKGVIVPDRIRAGLKSLGDSWEYEGEFIKRCNLSTTDFARFRDQFKEHCIEVRSTQHNTRRVWAGTKAFAAKCRETIA